MGGRGSGSAGGSGGGGKTDTPRIKTDIGKKRDEIRSKVNKAFEKSYLKTVKDENGRKIGIKIKVIGESKKHITNDILGQKVVSDRSIHRLGEKFSKSTFVKGKGLKHSRSDNKQYFFYFKENGKKLYFHVAKDIKVIKKEKRIEYVLYSITKKI